MEVVCNKCGYKIDIGRSVAVEHAHDNDIFKCKECGNFDVTLVDTGGINIKVDGISEDVIVDVIKEIAGNITLVDIVDFFKGGKPKQEEQGKSE